MEKIENDSQVVALGLMNHYQSQLIKNGRLEDAVMYILAMHIMDADNPRDTWIRVCKDLADMAYIGPLKEFTH